MKTIEKIQNFLEEINYNYFWKEQMQVLGIVLHHSILYLS